MSNLGWTDERVEMLKKLYADGLSSSQIAKRLGGGITRNAVIGKRVRLKLPPRGAASKPRADSVLKPPKSNFANRTSGQKALRARPPQKGPAAPQQRVFGSNIALPPLPPVEAAVVDFVDEAPGLATVATLGPRMCKWPIGNPESASFTYCGRRTEGRASYCHEHAQVAHKPAKPGQTAETFERSLRRFIG